MVDIKVDLKPEEVEAAIKKAIVDGAIGAQVRKALEDLQKSNNYSFSSAIESAIKGQVQIIVAEYVREQFTGPLRELVAKELTTQKMEEVIQGAVKGLSRGY